MRRWDRLRHQATLLCPFYQKSRAFLFVLRLPCAAHRPQALHPMQNCMVLQCGVSSPPLTISRFYIESRRRPAKATTGHSTRKSVLRYSGGRRALRRRTLLFLQSRSGVLVACCGGSRNGGWAASGCVVDSDALLVDPGKITYHSAVL